MASSLLTPSEWLKKPPRYLTASLLVSLGGLLNGLDTGTIGPITTMATFTSSFASLSSSMHGFVVSIVLVPATIAALFAGSIADSLGRNRAIAIGAALFALGAALEAGAKGLAMFVVGRSIVGAGEGVFLGNLIVYVAEISPPRHRAPLSTVIQLLITLGFCVGFFACYGTVDIPSSLSWRLPLVLQAVIALFLAVSSLFFLPDSPRWLASKGRQEEASKVWDLLGVSGAEREKDLLRASGPEGQTSVLAGESGQAGAANPLTNVATAVAKKRGIFKQMWDEVKSVKEIFSSKETLKPLMLGTFLMSMQQFSGIDGVIYYAPLLFQHAGLSTSTSTFLASGISAILIFLFTLLAIPLSSRIGRRPSTILGGLVLALCMFLVGLLYSLSLITPTSPLRFIVIACIYIFSIAYSMTWAIGMKLFASEIQPARSRALATSIGQAANCVSNFLVALFTPVLLGRSGSAVYWVFLGCIVGTVGVCVLEMPETMGVDLEAVRGLVVGEGRVVKGLKRWAKMLGERKSERAQGSNVAAPRASVVGDIELFSMG